MNRIQFHLTTPCGGCLSQHSIIIYSIPLLSKFTGIAKYTYEISKRILQLDHDLDSMFYYGYFSLRKSFISKGLQKVNMFDWDTSAKKHLAVFSKVMNQ